MDATNLIHSPTRDLEVRVDKHDREGVSSQIAVELDGPVVAQALGIVRGGRGAGQGWITTAIGAIRRGVMGAGHGRRMGVGGWWCGRVHTKSLLTRSQSQIEVLVTGRAVKMRLQIEHTPVACFQPIEWRSA